ncbi:alginate export family protein [Azospirillum sp. B510]|uniref:alginate export family protein n=1 Tax=Azospirillum sp. (strain B510) TaxID=137722 RepID=UPI0002F6A3D7|nr:alginate export family protein [Azospirillum sp. B510]
MCNALRVAPRIGARVFKPACLAGTALLALTAAAHADVTLHEQNGVTLEGGLTAGLGAISVKNANLGAGVTTPSGKNQKDRNWVEGYVAPSLKLTYATESVGTLYSGVRAVSSGTGGDGDAGGFTQGRQGRTDLDNLYVGWKSGDLLSSLGKDAIDLAYGRQNFAIGDSFIIGDGTLDSQRQGSYWLGPRRGWNTGTAVAKFDIAPVHADLFRLKSDKNSNTDVIYGGNLEWRFGAEGKSSLGASYMRIDESKLATRKGMDIYNLRALGVTIPSVPGLTLSAEYVKEHNNRAGAQLDASAWYGEAAYTFADVTWTPRASYRYSQFSGDNPGTAKSEAFDPLHLGAPRWGSWLQGEINGQYFPTSNSNVKVHNVQFAVQPTETLTLTALLYDFRFDRKPAGVTSSHVGNEINLAADWAATPNLLVSAAVGQFFAGDGGKQLLRGRKDSTVFEVAAIFTY